MGRVHGLRRGEEEQGGEVISERAGGHCWSIGARATRGRDERTAARKAPGRHTCSVIPVGVHSKFASVTRSLMDSISIFSNLPCSIRHSNIVIAELPASWVINLQQLLTAFFFFLAATLPWSAPLPTLFALE